MESCPLSHNPMKKQFKIAGIAVVVLAVIGLIVWLTLPKSNNVGQNNEPGTNGEVPDAMLENLDSEAAEATQALIDDATDIAGGETKTVQVSTVTGEGTENATTTTTEVKMVVIAPGTSGIDVNTGKVITETGAAVENDARAGSQEAPHESFAISENAIPESAIKLKVTSSSFTPNEFTVKKGQAVNLAVSNVNETTFSEIFRFDDPSLSAVVLGLAKGETKSITFNAPTKAGEYSFYSSMFDHRAQGAVGKMIVK